MVMFWTAFSDPAELNLAHVAYVEEPD